MNTRNILKRSTLSAQTLRTMLEILAFARYLAGKFSNRGKSGNVILLEADTGESAEIARQARLAGYSVHVVTDLYRNPAVEFAADVFKIDAVKEPDKVYDYSLKVPDLKAVLLGTDERLLPLMSDICQATGLPGPSKTAALSSLDKKVMRDRFDSHGLAAKWQILTREAILQGNITVPFPAVVKPSVGSASVGVIHVDNESELLEAYNSISDCGDVLLEEFLRGSQYWGEVLSRNGRHHIKFVGGEYFLGHPPLFPAKWMHINPPVSDDVYRLITDATKKALNACDIREGASFCELKVHNGVVKIIELTNRMSAKCHVEANVILGINHSREYLDMMILGDVAELSAGTRSILYLYIYDEKDLKVIDQLRADPDVSVYQVQMGGHYTPEVEYLARIVVYADDAEALLKYRPETDSTTTPRSIPEVRRRAKTRSRPKVEEPA